jgi:hypothetical protein
MFAELHEAVTRSSDCSVTIGKASQCVCSQEDPKKPCCCDVYTENPNHRCMQLHFMKLLQQALTLLSQLKKLHNVSAVRRTRNTSKETMLLQCVIQKTLTTDVCSFTSRSCCNKLSLFSQKELSQQHYTFDDMLVTLSLSLSLSRSLRNPRRGENKLRNLPAS